MHQQTKWSQFGTLITVFFFWGFVAASNDILIPVFKEKLQLEQWQSQMISVAFYFAYTIGAILITLSAKAIGEDILNRIGYKNGIALGLGYFYHRRFTFLPCRRNRFLCFINYRPIYYRSRLFAATNRSQSAWLSLWAIPYRFTKIKS